MVTFIDWYLMNSMLFGGIYWRSCLLIGILWIVCRLEVSTDGHVYCLVSYDSMSVWRYLLTVTLLIGILWIVCRLSIYWRSRLLIVIFWIVCRLGGIYWWITFIDWYLLNSMLFGVSLLTVTFIDWYLMNSMSFGGIYWRSRLLIVSYE